MLHLKNERKAKFFKIIITEETEVEKALKIILEKYNDIVSKRAHDIENCQTIKHIIRLLNKTSVVGK